MADDLDGKVFPAGSAALTGLQFTLTDASDGTPDLTGAAIDLRIFTLDGAVKITNGVLGLKTRQLPPVSSTPSLILSVGSGLTIITNSEDSQVGEITITSAQLVNLLDGAVKKAFSYNWVVTPALSIPIVRPLGDGYDGVFALGQEGYSLDALAKVS